MPEPEAKKLIQLNRVLNEALAKGASDIHFKVGLRPYLRVGGNLEYINTKVLEGEDLVSVVKSIVEENLQKKFSMGKDVDASFEQTDEKKEIHRYRVNIAHDKKGPYVAMRLIPDKILDVSDIGFPFDVWRDIVKLKRGLVLVTGVTGSGKTTTLASLIDYINRTQSLHIITLEDPIEYAYGPAKSIISQRESGVTVTSFADGLKYALRQDPDVLMVGEIRDEETALKALEASETGHIVFSTLHTKNAPETVRRYVSMFDVQDHDNIKNSLASNLAYVLSQQLIPYRPTNLPIEKTKTRTLAMEVMNVKDSPAIQHHLREGKYEMVISEMQIGRQHNMITMDARLKELYRQGKIEKGDAIAYAINQEQMVKELGKPTPQENLETQGFQY
ncbi:MAG: type IV pilus twitching motility protein PilT [Planctomycetota bacterium]|jgi:twitching motility protein PilT